MSAVLEGLETIYNNPSAVEDKYLTVDGYRTHYLEAGNAGAMPLVLVHGGSMDIGLGADRWYPNIIPLSRTFRVFAVDELGSGQTDAPGDPMDLSVVPVRAKHVIGFIEALDVGPVCLLGQSQGGWIVTYITLTRPDLVHRLVLVDSGSVAGSGWRPDGKSNHLPYMDKVFKPGTMIPKLDLRTREGIVARLKSSISNHDMIIDEFVDQCEALSEKWNDRYLEYTHAFWADADAWKRKREAYSIDGELIREHVHKIDIRPLIVWAKQSKKGLDEGLELYKRIPSSTFVVLDNANHFVWVDQARDFNGIVTWYLTKDEA